MQSLLPAFLAALLAEMGDKTQLLAMMLAVRWRRAGAVIGGIAVAAGANAMIAVAGGEVINDIISFRAVSLMVAIGLLSAAAGSFWPGKPPKLSDYGGVGAFGSSALGFFILEFGDKTQFLTLTLAARGGEPWSVGVGAACGVLLASVAAIILAEDFARVVPLRTIRLVTGALFLAVGLWVAVDALRLL